MTCAELKSLRYSLGLSLSQAAKLVEVTPRTWARWESTYEIPAGALKLFLVMTEGRPRK